MIVKQRLPSYLIYCLGCRYCRYLLPLLLLQQCQSPAVDSRQCFVAHNLCIDANGTQTDLAGNQLSSTVGADEVPSTIAGFNPNLTTNFVPQSPAAPQCYCPIVMGAADDQNADNDGDCLVNAIETGNANDLNNPNRVHSGDLNVSDTDGDGIPDGCEDKNHNGIFDSGESDPTSFDTDGDGLADGLEDRNYNGVRDADETAAFLVDSDGDGIGDGVEDVNHNGVCDAYTDINGNGQYDVGIDLPGESDPRFYDTDGDGLGDGIEDKNKNGLFDSALALQETCAFSADTDNDGLLDGLEDRNHNGQRDPGETDPRLTDTDNDGLPDGLEDRNHNGTVDSGETSPLLVDSDHDGIADGIEDRNHNGMVDTATGGNHTGCYNVYAVSGESDPTQIDSDGDGILDGDEDTNHNGICDVITTTNLLQPTTAITVLTESCAFAVDSDCDGLPDGLEDKNKNGFADPGETLPYNSDSDNDGLSDGCGGVHSTLGCEDLNNNGQVDRGETDPLNPDSDQDGLTDGCEIHFGPHPPLSGTSPLLVDSDGDGIVDGLEDKNHNCIYEPNLGETDPRVIDTALLGNVSAPLAHTLCRPDNQTQMTFLASARNDIDFQLALENEHSTLGNAPYHSSAYGLYPRGTFTAANSNSTLLGYWFQSPQGVVTPSGASGPVNRDIYGLVQFTSDIRTLDTVISAIITSLSSNLMVQGGAITARASQPMTNTFDSSSSFVQQFEYREVELTFSQKHSAFAVQQMLLAMLNSNNTLQWDGTQPTADLVYGAINCSQNANHCSTQFRLLLGGLLRPTKLVGSQKLPQIILTLALTPDDSQGIIANTTNERFAERRNRLIDLVSGHALTRYAATLRYGCDNFTNAMAHADALFVIDDSAAMQPSIAKLQYAMQNIKAALYSNANIIDLRFGLATTNPSAGARTACPSGCDLSCSQNGNCGLNCIDQTLGCIDPNVLHSSSQLTSENSNYPLPGGGGKFYAEFAALFDCASLGWQELGTANYLNSCLNAPYTNSSFNPFMAANSYYLATHAHFTRVTPNISCTSSPLDLYFNPNSNLDPFTSNQANSQLCTAPMSTAQPCCQRLTASCLDGLQIQSSGFCDLLRQMGGMPGIDANNNLTLSGRRHAGTEMGTRSARRLWSKQLPALPYDSTDSNAPLALRRACSAGNSNCVACTPNAANPNLCTLIPSVTLILSDEEDFYFKDDCMQNTNTFSALDGIVAADKQPLPTSCYYVDGNPNTTEQCSLNHCLAYSNAHDPTGYAPDVAQQIADQSYSLQYTNPTAPECSPTGSGSCIGDPCPYFATAAACVQNSACLWAPQYTLQATPHVFAAATGCYNRCSVYVLDQSFAGSPNAAQYALNQQNACKADSFCRWDASQVSLGYQGPLSPPPGPCVMRVPLNDCQSCKRYLRLYEAVNGLTANGNVSALLGFKQLGPVYSIVRQANQPGSGSFTGTGTQDTCGGGPATWGRGEGYVYRHVSTQTVGRMQDICANDYTAFMQQWLLDLATLSSPYPLTAVAVPSTLQVGLQRPMMNGNWQFINVPRSDLSGFVYDAVHNSIGFKSDPIDGVCAAGAGCAVDNTIDSYEISYAQSLPTVPQANDLVIVSYRSWQSSPCPAGCPNSSICVQQTCSSSTSTATCATSCGLGTNCVLGNCCTPGTLVSTCIPTYNCPTCQAFDNSSATCKPINNSCQCNTTNKQSCNPNAFSDTCLLASTCEIDSCTCVNPGVCPSGLFLENGAVSNCQSALACCATLAEFDQNCQLYDVALCAVDSNCKINAAGICSGRLNPCCANDVVPRCDSIATFSSGGIEQLLSCPSSSCSCADSNCAALGLFCDTTQNCSCYSNGI